MSQLKLSIATTDYDHFRDFRMGLVKAEGIDHNWLTLGHHEIFARQTFNREFDVSELSFAKFSTQITRDDCDIVGLPVVCSAAVADAVGRGGGLADLGERPVRGHTSIHLYGWQPPLLADIPFTPKTA